jgi:hypothetical protein
MWFICFSVPAVQKWCLSEPVVHTLHLKHNVICEGVPKIWLPELKMKYVITFVTGHYCPFKSWPFPIYAMVLVFRWLNGSKHFTSSSAILLLKRYWVKCSSSMDHCHPRETRENFHRFIPHVRIFCICAVYTVCSSTEFVTHFNKSLPACLCLQFF